MAAFIDRASLVTLGDELEQQVRSGGTEREVADLVDDQQLRARQQLELLFQTVLALGAGEQSHHGGRRGEQGPVPDGAGLHTEGYGQMRLAYAGRSEQQHVLGIGDVTTGAQLAHDLRIERGLELEVEALERLVEGKAGHADAHGRVAILLAGQLRREQLLEEVAVRELS